ncbi:hypothetical protein KAR91_04645 [Candidatus Pacearchaeota archaeon]|nr:hypothetical protein [Candidatus Pacearchaeota archaeon]
MSVKWSTNAGQQVYDGMIAEAKKAQDEIVACYVKAANPCFDENIKGKLVAHSTYMDSLMKAAEAASIVDSRLIFALKPEQ